MISINEEYSYIEILSMYLQKFLLKMNLVHLKRDRNIQLMVKVSIIRMEVLWNWSKCI